MADANQAVGTATSAASVALDPYNPIAWASLAKNVGSMLGLFGGGSTTSVLQGFKLNGNVTSGGFNGTVTAFDQLGHTWDATGERGYLTSGDFFNGIFNSQSLVDNKLRLQGLLDKSPLPINFTTAAPSGQLAQTFWEQLRSTFNGVIAQPDQVTTVATPTDTTTIAAPTIPATTMPANSPGSLTTSASGSGGGGGSTVAPAPSASSSSIVAGVPDLVVYAIGLAIAYWIYKEAH